MRRGPSRPRAPSIEPHRSPYKNVQRREPLEFAPAGAGVACGTGPAWYVSCSMSPMKSWWPAVLVLVWLGTFAAAAAGTPGRATDASFAGSKCWDTRKGVSFHVDNDLLAGAPHDSDYTGGFALSWTPRNQSRRALPQSIHWRLDRLFGLGDGDCRRHALQLGLLSITPGTLRSPVPLTDDRPFASLVYFGSTAVWNGSSDRVALQSTLEIGALGLDVAEKAHAALHRLVGDERPMGYEYQISKGGELTGRYVLARHDLLHNAVGGGETLQVKSTASLSVGYLTEASVGWSMRWGRIASPWQTFTPEMAGYLPTVPPLPADDHRELYFFAGARMRLRAFNALTQGQLRDSVHVLHSAELERWIGEAFLGAHWRPSPGWELSYTIRANTPELRRDPARRSMVWAGLEMTRRF